MATNQKILPCPNCKTDDQVAVYTYESGWRHVECVKCDYLGPGEGSVRQAIKSHNEKMRATPPSLPADKVKPTDADPR